MSTDVVSAVFAVSIMFVDNSKQFYKDDSSKRRQQELHNEARAT